MGLKVGDKAPELLGVNENGEEILRAAIKERKSCCISIIR